MTSGILLGVATASALWSMVFMHQKEKIEEIIEKIEEIEIKLTKNRYI